MCGIVGVVALDGGPISPTTLQRMNDVQRHRGPDGEGFLLSWLRPSGFESRFVEHTSRCDGHADARVALGHRRLAILDLSDRGLQPMSVPGSGVWIVFNGEIYNHLELKAELEAQGISFATRTDTEVLLQAYLQWGEACLERLEGMFAFAIWDERRGRLFCARDRLGIKPLYYAVLPGYFLFASEVKALVQFPALRAAPDDDAVLGFLVHGNCDYGERTLFREVKALPAAHALCLDMATAHLATRQYWRLEPRCDPGISDRDRLGKLRELLLRAIRTHLISDVRAGSCLSGGLDSSTVASLVGHLLREQPEATAAVGDSFYTFTSCWEDRTLDERDYALAVAQAVGASPHLVFPAAADFWSSFACMAWHQDMPFYSLSFYAQWRVMRAAREGGVKVLLDGQGGDEVFGGYAKFRYAYLASLLRAGRLGTALGEAAGMMRQGDLYLLDIRKGYRYLPTSLRRFLGVDSLLRGVLRADWDRVVADDSTPATRWWRSATKARGSNSPGTRLQEIQVEDIVTDTLPALLRMEDRSSMAFSLEARVPLLDHRVVEYGLSLPDHLKVHRGWSKFAVRQVMGGMMDDVVRLRRTKLGFAAPDRRWLAHDLAQEVTGLLHDQLRCSKYVDQEAISRWYRSSEARRANTEAYLGLFRILALEMWMRAFELS